MIYLFLYYYFIEVGLRNVVLKHNVKKL